MFGWTVGGAHPGVFGWTVGGAHPTGVVGVSDDLDIYDLQLIPFR